jgi:ferritin-like metal-binding protein YciE
VVNPAWNALIRRALHAPEARHVFHSARLYVSELQDLFDAEQQIIQAVAGLAAKASDPDLKKAFGQHVERSRLHLERLEWLFVERDLPKTITRTTAIEALIRDADRRVHALEEPYVRDAALIAAAQLVAHYEMAAYGCVRTYAHLLEHRSL